MEKQLNDQFSNKSGNYQSLQEFRMVINEEEIHKEHVSNVDSNSSFNAMKINTSSTYICRNKTENKKSQESRIVSMNSNSKCGYKQKQLKEKNCRDSLKMETTKVIPEKKSRGAQQASSPYAAKLRSCCSNIESKVKEENRSLSPPPKIRSILGTKVTIVDEKRKVLVVDLIPPETCDLIRQMTEDHVALMEKKHGKDAGAFTWRTLYTYTKMDLPCSEVKGLASRITDHIMNDVRKIVGEIYGKKREAQKLKPRSWKEPHLLKYQKEEGKPEHTGIEMHYDGCDITWQLMLTRLDEYEGGGTYFRCLRKTLKLKQGQVIIHPGELYHKGLDITGGLRFLIVCFMDGFDPKIMDDSDRKNKKEMK